MKVDDWKSGILRRADEALKYDWPAFDWLTPGMKPTATAVLGAVLPLPGPARTRRWQSDPPNDIHRHVCPRCKKVIENDPYFDQCARQEYFRHRFADIRALAMAWLLTGDAKYADKAIAIMLAYADAYPKMTVAGYRSTGGSSQAGEEHAGRDLVPAGFRRGLFAARRLSRARRGEAQAASRNCWSMQACARSAMVANSTTSRPSTSAPMAAWRWSPATGRCWARLCTATSAGTRWSSTATRRTASDTRGRPTISLPGRRRSAFATFAMDRGLNLMTPRFKRVYDGSLAMGYGDGTFYELAYRALQGTVLSREDRRTDGNIPARTPSSPACPTLPPAASVPAVSKLMDGMGYIFLRRGHAADSREIHMNYKRAVRPKRSRPLHHLLLPQRRPGRRQASRG